LDGIFGRLHTRGDGPGSRARRQQRVKRPVFRGEIFAGNPLKVGGFCTPDGVEIGLETHGDFARAEYAAEIVSLANHPKVRLIWDVANSAAAGDEIQHAARVVQPHLAHVHLRDAKPVAGSEHWLPVLAGDGRVSFAEAVATLGALNYDGFVSFEWEKFWHPEIEEPEIALPDFINAIRELVGDRSDTTECSGVGK